MTTFEGSHNGPTLRVGIVCSRFNEFIVTALLDGARRGLTTCGVADHNVDVAWVPGAFEIPVAIRTMATTGPVTSSMAFLAASRGGR